MRAQDVLPDGVDQIQFNGVSVRKGSVAAFLANAKVLADASATAEARTVSSRGCRTSNKPAAQSDITEAMPALCAAGLFEVLQPRDETVRAFVEARKSSHSE
jgi:hypothetical protein